MFRYYQVCCWQSYTHCVNLTAPQLPGVERHLGQWPAEPGTFTLMVSQYPKDPGKQLRCAFSCTAFVPGLTEHYAVAWHRQISSVNYGLSNDVTWNETNLGQAPIVVFWARMQFSKANPGLEGRQKKLLCHQPIQGSFRAAREGAKEEHLTTTAIKHRLVAQPGGVAGAWIFLPLC